jgi:hypothetical protein
MNVFASLERLLIRQQQIIDCLPAELLQEYESIEATIRYVWREAIERGPNCKIKLGCWVVDLMRGKE